jgi:hypothetical protein
VPRSSGKGRATVSTGDRQYSSGEGVGTVMKLVADAQAMVIPGVGH